MSTPTTKQLMKKLTESPTMTVPEAGQILGNMSRGGSYEAAKQGFIKTVPLGNRTKVVPTAWIREQLQIKK